MSRLDTLRASLGGDNQLVITSRSSSGESSGVTFTPLDGGRRYARWGIDANKGDRLFIDLMSRLTRLDAGPIEIAVPLAQQRLEGRPGGGRVERRG